MRFIFLTVVTLQRYSLVKKTQKLLLALSISKLISSYIKLHKSAEIIRNYKCSYGAESKDNLLLFYFITTIKLHYDR